MANIQNLRMGPCSVNFNTVDCGHTLGGVKITITRKHTPLKVDKYGDSPVDMVLTDVELKVAMKIAEPVADQIRLALPESAYNVNGTNKQLGIAAGEGFSMRNNAGGAALLILHPLSKIASDTTEDFQVYLAVPTVDPVINYEVANQRVFDLEFEALVSEAFTAGRRLGHFGPANIS